MKPCPKGRTAEEQRIFHRSLVLAAREKQLSDLAAGRLKCDCSKVAVVLKHLEPVCAVCDGLEAYTNQRQLRQSNVMKDARAEMFDEIGRIPRWVRNSRRIAAAEEALTPFEPGVDNHPLGVIVSGHGIYSLVRP